MVKNLQDTVNQLAQTVQKMSNVNMSQGYLTNEEHKLKEGKGKFLSSDLKNSSCSSDFVDALEPLMIKDSHNVINFGKRSGTKGSIFDDLNDAHKVFDGMLVLLVVALIGATVGGLIARQRKAEMLRLNEQLRQINAALKRQAKIESYAPALSYAPAAAKIPENEVIIDPRKQELISHLKNGKNFLRNQNPDKAFYEFKTALELAQKLKDPIKEKKAARGLGASLQRQGKHRDAIKYHSMVLSISEREGEDSGNTEAYGAIADCYTELGDLEKAATFYDQYIARLQAD